MSEKNGYSATSGTDYVKCPFFVAHEKKAIRCEGVIGGCRCSNIFSSAEEKGFHMVTYCENRFDRCEHYISVMHWQWPEE